MVISYRQWSDVTGIQRTDGVFYDEAAARCWDHLPPDLMIHQQLLQKCTAAECRSTHVNIAI